METIMVGIHFKLKHQARKQNLEYLISTLKKNTKQKGFIKMTPIDLKHT